RDRGGDDGAFGSGQAVLHGDDETIIVTKRQEPSARRVVRGEEDMRKTAWMAWSYWRTKNVSRVQRGYKVADEKGCFTCHGPGGQKGAPDPGMDTVPTFSAGVM